MLIGPLQAELCTLNTKKRTKSAPRWERVNPFLPAEKEKLAKKSRKWHSHNPPPTQRIAIFGGTTLCPVIKIGMLSCESSAEAAAVAAARQRDVGGSLATVWQQWQRQRRWRQRNNTTSAVAAARQRDVGGRLAVARQRLQGQHRWQQCEARRQCTA